MYLFLPLKYIKKKIGIGYIFCCMGSLAITSFAAQHVDLQYENF